MLLSSTRIVEWFVEEGDPPSRSAIFGNTVNTRVFTATTSSGVIMRRPRQPDPKQTFLAEADT